MSRPRKNDADSSPDSYHLLFGGYRLPRHVAEDNFLLVGQRGSGKTLSMRLLAQSVIDAFTSGSRRKAVVYDPKGDWYSIVNAIQRGLPYRSPAQVKILNPFDSRGFAYDLAADFASLGGQRHPRPLTVAADGFAKALIPDDALGGDNQFWVTAAQMIISALVQSFARLTPAKRADGVPSWTLRDVISAACDERLVDVVLRRDPVANRTLARYRRSDKMYASALQTVASFAWDIEPAATAWDHHLSEKRTFTGRDWLESEDILVLCGSYDPPSAVEPINGVVMNFIREQLVTAKEVSWAEPTHPETWFFLDEFPKLHAVRDVQDFFTLTRSKGGVQVIGFQSVTDMYARFGEHGADTILGLCGILGVLRLTCSKTAEYYERHFGSCEVEREYVDRTEQTTTNWGPGGLFGPTQTGTSESTGVSRRKQFMTLPGVLRQEFMQLRPVSRGDLDIDGWYMLHGGYARVRYSALDAGLIVPNASDANGFDITRPDDGPNFSPLNPEHAEPRAWSPTDFHRLGVTVPDGHLEAERQPAMTIAEVRFEAKRWRSESRE